MNFKLRIRQYIKMAVQTFFLPLCYRLYRKRGRKKDLIVFADAHHNSRPENMQLLWEELQKKENSPKIVEWYLDYQKASFGQVLRHMTTFMKMYARAKCVVICDNFLPVASCRKDPDTKVVQLWHACGAFKKFGYDTVDDIPANYKGNVFQNMDFVTVSAPYCVKPFASAMRLPEENVQPIGVSRTDVYSDQGWREDCVREFYQQYPEAKHKKVVLWAPTFRGNPGDPQKIDLDIPALQKALGDEWMVLTRVHPHMMKKYGKDNCPIVTERLFPVVDVLIADYSSLIYEYLLFDKPMLLYTPDLEEYQRSRGFYLKVEDLPGKIIRNEIQLADAVRKTQDTAETAEQEKRDIFMQRYMSGCDGHATERIAAYILK